MELKLLRTKQAVKMKTNFKKILFLVLMSMTINAQELPQVVPPSPEASALFKFNEIPVSLNNGLHNTSIPLLEIISGGVKIPVSLSYHSRGVQVSEISSRVGTGWTLSYGGMISRQIRGLPDDLTFGYNNGTFSYTNNNSEPSFYLNYQERLNELNNVNIQYDGNYDYYPDKFMINTNFFSGEFYFDKNNPNLITQKFSDIKIVPQYDSNSKIIGFQVTDNQGNNYFFGGLEVVGSQFINEYEWVENTYTFSQNGFNSSNGNNNTLPYSSWFLRKIITNTNEVIDFIYENEVTTYFRRGGDTDAYTDQVFSEEENAHVSVNFPVTCHFSKIQSHQKILSEIQYKEGKIKFIKSNDNTRLDVAGGYTLDRIELYDKNQQPVKQIKLNYYYTTSLPNDNINSNSVLTNDGFAKKRLFLENIQFKNALGTNIEKSYQFEYDDQVLPSRHSNSIDFWGYYNGKNRGNYINYGNTDFDDAIVDPVKIQAGLLKKIIYPTGGYTTFEYEPNIVLNQLPLTYNEIQDESITLPHSYVIPNTNPVIHKNEILSYIDPVRYNNSTGRYEIQIIISPYAKGPYLINISQCNFNFTCQLINNNSGQNYYFGSNSGLISIPTILPGSYTFVFDPNDRDWNPYANGDLESTIAHMFIATMQWNEIVDGDKIYAPGNRIKKINNFTADSNLEFSKWYSYVNESNNSPNGALFSTSNFRIVKYMVGQFPIYENIKYSNNGLFNSYSKDNFGYHTVSEYFLDRNNYSKDKMEYRYSFYTDLGNYYLFPYHPISDNEWLRGLELSKIFYNRENGLFKKVKEINNDYLLNNSILISLSGSDFIGGMYSFGFEIEKPLAENFPTHPYVRNRTQFCYPNSTGKNLNHYVYNSTLVYGYRTSFFTGGTLDLHETKVTEYFDNGQEMETVTTYGYDYNNHYNVASVSTTNSFGEISETKYQYAKNISNAVNDALVTNNMVAIPLITETFKNGEKLSTVETQYKNWDNVLLAPEFIKASKGSAPLETRLIYNLVDPANGNPLQVQKEGGMTICYIWGYNKTQPVAKIENITYSAIPSTRIQAIENATNEASLITALNALRNDTALSNAMVTTYTYKLLVGISTVTDPKGDKQTYHYDGFGRLQYVKDAEENILSENQYHYRTQN
jgi:YD repeat-containing protein